MDLPTDNVDTPVLPTEAKPRFQPNTMSGMLMIFGASLLMVAIIAILLGQRIGYNRGLSYANEQAKKIAQGEEISATNIKNLKLKADTLQTQLATAQQERDISLANLANLRNDMQLLTTTNLQAQQEQTFLTAALAKRGGIPLQIVGAKIVPLPENAYEYRFDVGMVDPSNQEKTLIPKMTLLDDVNMVEVPLEPRSYKINGIARVRGRFLMPKDFLPKQIKIEFASNGQTLEQVYNWQLGQPVDDMPYSLEEVPEADKRPVASAVDTVTDKVPTKDIPASQAQP
ncbi:MULTISPECIES: hypothetical protein [unclassified Moraxella]|uniref:hypothetical protein n=1 Tax=unclassified Moraxella TaxID=2685852 RepID=UPI003AF64A0A